MKIFQSKISLNNKGMSYVNTAVLVLVLSMLISLILSYASLMTITNNVKDNTQRVLDSFCIKKAAVIYNSIKNGNKIMISSEYTDEFMLLTKDELNLKKLDNSMNLWYNISEEKDNVIYKFDEPLTANLDDNTLTLKTNFELVIPISFAGKRVTDLRIPLTIKSVYNVI